MEHEPPTAVIQRRSSFVGTGCLVQALGLIGGAALFWMVPVVGWVLGPLLGLALLIAGGRMAVQLECSNCHNPIANNRVRLCPACRATFR